MRTKNTPTDAELDATLRLYVLLTTGEEPEPDMDFWDLDPGEALILEKIVAAAAETLMGKVETGYGYNYEDMNCEICDDLLDEPGELCDECDREMIDQAIMNFAAWPPPKDSYH